MTKEELYGIWAPTDSVWSQWAKPVLFASLDRGFELDPRMGVPADITWAPSPQSGTALVLDLPGSEGIDIALVVAALGFRHVPLYNAQPGTTDCSYIGTSSELDLFVGPVALVDVRPIAVALQKGAAVLQQGRIERNAPPVFLLDARRRGGGIRPDEGDFDNRSISFPTDFPSANFLLAHAICRVIVVQHNDLQPQPDLAHTLRGWQDGGIQIQAKDLGAAGAPVDIVVARPSRFRSILHRILETFGFRRNVLGGFGGIVSGAGAG